MGLSPRMQHVGRRSRLLVEDRGGDLGRLSEVPDHAADLGAQRQPCKIHDGLPHRQAAARRADFHGRLSPPYRSEDSLRTTPCIYNVRLIHGVTLSEVA